MSVALMNSDEDKDIYAVYGAGGCGRGVMPLAAAQLARAGVSAERLVFVAEPPESHVLNSRPVLDYSDFLTVPAADRYAVIAVADGAVRRRLVRRCADDGVRPWTVAAANVVRMDDVLVGEGAILSPFVTLTSNIRIGRHFQANLYSYVEHDCRIGDFVTFGPGVHCNGNVTIEDLAYVGAGAMLRQGKPGKPLRIGRGAVIGMGAVVTKDVPPGITVIGNPARPLVRK